MGLFPESVHSLVRTDLEMDCCIPDLRDKAKEITKVTEGGIQTDRILEKEEREVLLNFHTVQEPHATH